MVDSKKIFWASASLAFASLPLGYAVGHLLALGQDGPGQVVGLQLGFNFGGILWLAATVITVGLLPGAWPGLSSGHRSLSILAMTFFPLALLWSSVSTQQYAIQISNNSGERIHDVLVWRGQSGASFGIMRHGNYARRDGVKSRPPGTLVVGWTDAEGQSHQVSSELSTEVPRRFDGGTLEITIEPNGTVRSGFWIYPDVFDPDFPTTTN